MTHIALRRRVAASSSRMGEGVGRSSAMVVCFRVELAIDNLELWRCRRPLGDSSVVSDPASTAVTRQSRFSCLQHASNQTTSNPQHVRYVRLRSYVFSLNSVCIY
jgi:hypothetical protein